MKKKHFKAGKKKQTKTNKLFVSRSIFIVSGSVTNISCSPLEEDKNLFRYYFSAVGSVKLRPD